MLSKDEMEHCTKNIHGRRFGCWLDRQLSKKINIDVFACFIGDVGKLHICSSVGGLYKKKNRMHPALPVVFVLLYKYNGS